MLTKNFRNLNFVPKIINFRKSIAKNYFKLCSKVVQHLKSPKMAVLNRRMRRLKMKVAKIPRTRSPKLHVVVQIVTRTTCHPPIQNLRVPLMEAIARFVRSQLTNTTALWELVRNRAQNFIPR